MALDKKQINERIKKNALASIALWQFMGFILLICVIWVTEVMDLSALFFKTRPVPVNIFRASIITAGTIISSIIIVGHTYVQQKHVIQGLLVICSSCGKVKMNQKLWQEMREYVEDKSLAAFSHSSVIFFIKKCHFGIFIISLFMMTFTITNFYIRMNQWNKLILGFL